VRKSLRQQSKDFYATSFDSMVKRWDKSIKVGGEYVEKQNVFPRFEHHMFYVLYPFVTYLLNLPCTNYQVPVSDSTVTYWHSNEC
jgi:hypothetical protein